MNYYNKIKEALVKTKHIKKSKTILKTKAT